MYNYGLISISRQNTHEPSITLNISIFTVKGAGFGTPEHAIKSLFSYFKIQSDFKFNCFKPPEIMSMSRMAPFELTCENSDVSSEKQFYNACFCEAHRRKNRIKNGCSGSGRNSLTTRFNSVLSWDISQLKCLVCYKEVGDALEMK